MTSLRVIDALQLPEVLAGSKWIALPLPSLFGTPPDFTLLQQTIGVDPRRKRMYWCDGTYHPTAIAPSYFSSEAALSLPQLLGPCALVDALDTPRTPDAPDANRAPEAPDAASASNANRAPDAPTPTVPPCPRR